MIVSKEVNLDREKRCYGYVAATTFGSWGGEGRKSLLDITPLFSMVIGVFYVDNDNSE